MYDDRLATNCDCDCDCDCTAAALPFAFLGMIYTSAAKERCRALLCPGARRDGSAPCLDGAVHKALEHIALMLQEAVASNMGVRSSLCLVAAAVYVTARLALPLPGPPPVATSVGHGRPRHSRVWLAYCACMFLDQFLEALRLGHLGTWALRHSRQALRVTVGQPPLNFFGFLP
jgi:hypothetical protein